MDPRAVMSQPGDYFWHPGSTNAAPLAPVTDNGGYAQIWSRAADVVKRPVTGSFIFMPSRGIVRLKLAVDSIYGHAALTPAVGSI